MLPWIPTSYATQLPATSMNTVLEIADGASKSKCTYMQLNVFSILAGAIAYCHVYYFNLGYQHPSLLAHFACHIIVCFNSIYFTLFSAIQTLSHFHCCNVYYVYCIHAKHASQNTTQDFVFCCFTTLSINRQIHCPLHCCSCKC
jgi:hypothetical protein